MYSKYLHIRIQNTPGMIKYFLKYRKRGFKSISITKYSTDHIGMRILSMKISRVFQSKYKLSKKLQYLDPKYSKSNQILSNIKKKNFKSISATKY